MAMDSASEVLEDALKFPMSDDDWVVTVLVGGVLIAVYYFFAFITAIFFPLIIVTFVFLLVPIFLIQGFLVGVIREVLAGEDLPEWSDAGWQQLLGDGVKLALVGFAYSAVLIIPIVVLALGVGLLGGAAGEQGASAVTGVGSALVSILYFVGVLVLSYFLPAATVNFARERSVGAAFDVGTISDVILTRDYLVGWLLVIAVSILANIAATVVSITIVGILLVPWISFFFAISFVYIFAHAYAGALDLDIPLEDVEAAEA